MVYDLYSKIFAFYFDLLFDSYFPLHVLLVLFCYPQDPGALILHGLDDVAVEVAEVEEGAVAAVRAGSVLAAAERPRRELAVAALLPAAVVRPRVHLQELHQAVELSDLPAEHQRRHEHPRDAV